MRKRLLQSGTTASGIVYYIYEDEDGIVFVETLCTPYCFIAENIDEFKRMPINELERKIYGAEMRSAR